MIRYSQGDNVNGLSLTAMGYHGKWNATEASPQRAIDSGLIDRFGSIDDSDGGNTYRYSVGGEWQRSNGNTLSKVQAYGLGYGLNLISNFTFFLDDPVHGDQVEQVDRRFVTGVRAFQKRQTPLGRRVRCRTRSACSSATTTSRKSRSTTRRNGCASRRRTTPRPW